MYYFFQKEEVDSALQKAAARAEKHGKHPSVTGIIPEERWGATLDGNFTMLFVQQGVRTFMGVAKRSPRDTENREAGLAIACRRLVEQSFGPAF